MDRRHDFERAYAEAEYRIDLPSQPLLLRVGLRDPKADTRLRDEAGVQSHWVILTPFNPRSRTTPVQTNRRRLAKLIAELDARQQRWWPSTNSAAAGAEPVELGVLWCDPAAGAAETLARDFEQNAVLSGRLGAAPKLHWID
jgi:hypothetical protein